MLEEDLAERFLPSPRQKLVFKREFLKKQFPCPLLEVPSYLWDNKKDSAKQLESVLCNQREARKLPTDLFKNPITIPASSEEEDSASSIESSNKEEEVPTSLPKINSQEGKEPISTDKEEEHDRPQRTILHPPVKRKQFKASEPAPQVVQKTWYQKLFEMSLHIHLEIPTLILIMVAIWLSNRSEDTV